MAGNGVGRLVLPHPTPLIPQPQSPLLSAAGAPAADHEQLLRAPADHAKLIRVPAVGHEHLLRGPVVEHEELLPVEGDTVILHHQVTAPLRPNLSTLKSKAFAEGLASDHWLSSRTDSKDLRFNSTKSVSSGDTDNYNCQFLLSITFLYFAFQ